MVEVTCASRSHAVVHRRRVRSHAGGQFAEHHRSGQREITALVILSMFGGMGTKVSTIEARPQGLVHLDSKVHDLARELATLNLVSQLAVNLLPNERVWQLKDLQAPGDAPIPEAWGKVGGEPHQARGMKLLKLLAFPGSEACSSLLAQHLRQVCDKPCFWCFGKPHEALSAHGVALVDWCCELAAHLAKAELVTLLPESCQDNGQEGVLGCSSSPSDPAQEVEVALAITATLRRKWTVVCQQSKISKKELQKSTFLGQLLQVSQDLPAQLVILQCPVCPGQPIAKLLGDVRGAWRRDPQLEAPSPKSSLRRHSSESKGFIRGPQRQAWRT